MFANNTNKTYNSRNPSRRPFMKVLLIYPEFPDTFWSFKHALKFIRKSAALAAAGAADRRGHAAARLGQAPGRPQRARPDRTRTWPGPTIVFVSAHDRAAPVGARAASRAASAAGRDGRRRRAALHAETRTFPEVDHFVLNEAETDAAAVPGRPGARLREAHLPAQRSSPTSARRRCRAGSCSTCGATPR